MMKPFRNLETKIDMNKAWAVIIFTDSKDYSVIPVNWFNYLEVPTYPIDEYIDLTSVKFCVWPNYRVINDDIINAEEPESNWTLYKIQVVHNEIFTDFEQAWYKKVHFEDLRAKAYSKKSTLAIKAEKYRIKKAKDIFTRKLMLKSSRVDKSNIIGDGTVSSSAVSNNANNNKLTVLPMTQSKTHSMIKDIHHDVEMIEIKSPEISDAPPESDSETNDDNKINMQDENKDNNN